MRQIIIVFLAVVACSTASAEASLSVEQLPDWAREKWAAFSTARSLEVSTRINPFVWRGDFDGDGLQDLALFVRASTSGKEGIAIMFRGPAVPVMMGAGNSLGNGGDDFSWLDFWSVVEADAPPRSSDDAKAKLGADRLLVAKDGSASALILLQNGKPIWRQEGD